MKIERCAYKLKSESYWSELPTPPLKPTGTSWQKSNKKASWPALQRWGKMENIHNSSKCFEQLAAEQKIASRLKWAVYRNLPAEEKQHIPTEGKYAPLSYRTP